MRISILSAYFLWYRMWPLKIKYLGCSNDVQVIGLLVRPLFPSAHQSISYKHTPPHSQAGILMSKREKECILYVIWLISITKRKNSLYLFPFPIFDIHVSYSYLRNYCIFFFSFLCLPALIFVCWFVILNSRIAALSLRYNLFPFPYQVLN